MRIACPPLVYGCPFINFTSSKSDMELITRRIIERFEGDANKNLDKYATTGSPEYERMVAAIAEELGLTSLRFNSVEELIRAIGLILLGFGVVQVGLSLKSHDPSQRANGFLTLAGGVIITFAKEILDLIVG